MVLRFGSVILKCFGSLLPHFNPRCWAISITYLYTTYIYIYTISTPKQNVTVPPSNKSMSKGSIPVGWLKEMVDLWSLHGLTELEDVASEAAGESWAFRADLEFQAGNEGDFMEHAFPCSFPKLWNWYWFWSIQIGRFSKYLEPAQLTVKHPANLKQPQWRRMLMWHQAEPIETTKWNALHSYSIFPIFPNSK